MLSKALAVAVIILFLGLAIQPSIATVQTETEIDIEPKDYLFQTIIDIANNPEVKNLFEQYDNDLFKVNIDRGVYRKLLLRTPRLMFNTLFTKPSLSIEYLDKCYNNGIQITSIIGEDETLEMVESVEVTNMEFFYKLNSIITKDEELYNRLETLKEMNEELNSGGDYPRLCLILLSILAIEIAPVLLVIELKDLIDEYKPPVISMIFQIAVILWMPIKFPILAFTFVLIFEFGCLQYPYNNLNIRTSKRGR